MVKVEQEADFARVEVDTPEGTYSLEAEWLVAADGGRSPIRTAMNLQMEGASYEGFFVIADIKIDLPLPTERLAYFDPDWNPGNTILMHREPHGIWRVDYQLPAGETPEQALRPESLKARIDAQLAMIGHAGARWEMAVPLDAKQTVEWYGKHLDMKFVLAIAEDEVPSTKAPDPYMHVFLDDRDHGQCRLPRLCAASLPILGR